MKKSKWVSIIKATKNDKGSPITPTDWIIDSQKMKYSRTINNLREYLCCVTVTGRKKNSKKIFPHLWLLLFLPNNEKSPIFLLLLSLISSSILNKKFTYFSNFLSLGIIIILKGRLFLSDFAIHTRAEVSRGHHTFRSAFVLYNKNVIRRRTNFKLNLKQLTENRKILILKYEAQHGTRLFAKKIHTKLSESVKVSHPI